MSIFWLPVAAGLLLGKLSGGHISHLAQIRLRHSWLLLASVAVQVALIFTPPVPPEHGIEPLRVCLPLAMAAMGVFVALNWRLPGMLIALLGVTANLVVIVANSGLMPISPEALIASGRTQSMELALEHPGIRLPRSKDVILAWEDTRLPWLSDMVVTPPVPRRMVVSAGDLIIAAGLAYLTAEVVRKPIEKKEQERGATDADSHIVSPRATSRW